jgi:hypothetical protein
MWRKFLFWWTALAAGLRHGRHGLAGENHYLRIPPQGDHGPARQEERRHSPLELELVALAEAQITKLVERWLRTKARLTARLRKVQFQWAVALAEFRERVERHREERYREPEPAVGPKLYVAVMVALGLGETAFNSASFISLRIQDWETWTLAAVISVAAISLAHLIGAARQEARAGGKIPPFRMMMCIGLAALTICAISVTTLRAQWNTTKGLALGGLNAVFIAAGVALSLGAHRDAGLANLVRQKRHSARRLERIWRRWCRLVAKREKARSRNQQRAIAMQDCSRARLAEYRRGLMMSAVDQKPAAHLQEPIDGLFRERTEWEEELETTPPPLGKILEEVQATPSHWAALLEKPWDTSPARLQDASAVAQGPDGTGSSTTSQADGIRHVLPGGGNSRQSRGQHDQRTHEAGNRQVG